MIFCRFKVVISKEYDPFSNLAIEEYLFKKISENEVILFLWQNNNSVIIGRNQNPYFECNMDVIKKYNIQIVRRITGGGAVYHDLGNLNYSVIQKNKIFSKEAICEKILMAINHFGYEAILDGRNDIVINKRKISGTAFLERNDRFLHHGCILVSADLKKMTECLNVNSNKLSGKRIDSISARVTNLADLNSAVRIDDLKKSIIVTFKTDISTMEMLDFSLDMRSEEFESILQRYKSPQWNLGNGKEMTITLYDRFAWGDIRLAIKTDGISILDSEIYSDSLEIDIFRNLRLSLLNSKFQKIDIIDSIKNISGNEEILRDICNMICKEPQIL